MKRLAAIFLAVPILLTGCVVPYGGATPTSTVSPPSGAKVFSNLDAAGIEQIKASKIARLDMTTGWLTKRSVGLEDGTSQAPSVSIDDGVMELTIEAPTGLVRAKTDGLRLNGMNTRSDFTEVTYFLTAESLDDYIALIRDGVDRYGIDSESAEQWIDSTTSQPEDRSDFAIAPGTSTGLQVTYDLRYDGSKATQVIIVHVNSLPA
jgi:hypothetical protein